MSGHTSGRTGGATDGEACDITTASGMTCNWYPSSADPPSNVDATCTSVGGTPTPHCPAGALGCCMQPTGTVCYYFMSDLNGNLEKACGTAGGAWTLTPP
ncbi:MAG TPA: hypothetical protein VGI10_03415 [Polyangiaceae bacterium]